MNEQQKYQVIKSLVDHDGNKKAAALKLGCTIRTINRMIIKYKEQGKAGFLHGNRNRQPVHALPKELVDDIVTLYQTKYEDATFSYACELLAEHEGINISPSALTAIMYKHHIISPRTTKAVRKRITKELRELQKETKAKKKSDEIQTAIVAIENAHSRRPRCTYFGEMIQMDASVHLWFGGFKTHLHAAIDDCTGEIVGAYFDKEETLNGYYHVFHQILTTHGIPAMFFTDRRTIFADRQNKKDSSTQFGYACKQLGVEIKFSSIPQAKGRVERLFNTLQQRLPIALRLAGITEISEANTFLNSYIKKHNAKFALQVHSTKSVFEKQPDLELINQTLAVLAERTVDSGHCIKFKNKYYKTMDKRGLQTCFRQGTKGLVIETFDGRLLFSADNKVYELDFIPDHAAYSKEFDFKIPEQLPRKRNIPDGKHPWRHSNFLKYRQHGITEDMRIC